MPRKRTERARLLLPFVAQAAGDVSTIIYGDETGGVDVPQLKTDFDAHEAGTAAGMHAGGVGTHSHQDAGQGGKIDHGLGLSGLGDDDHPQYAGISQGEYITGVWTHLADLNTQSIYPIAPDTYDLGSPALPWRKGYLSELDAVVFSEKTISVIGGWFYIAKAQGNLGNALPAGATGVNFGQTMTIGDIVLLRSPLQVEYLTVATHVSGTSYTVTRDVDGSGQNDWPAGAVYVVLGQAGDGRIELNATDTPRISVVRQGATYNAQTEDVRLGDLNGWQGAGLSGYGMAMGNYSGGEYMYYNPTAGMVIRGTVRADDGYLGTLSVDGVLSLGVSGGLYQGSGSFASPTTGLKIWNASGVGRIAGFSDGDEQWGAATDGKFYAGDGRVTLDRDGIQISMGTSLYNKIKWKDGSTVVGEINVRTTTSTDQMALKAGTVELDIGGTNSNDGALAQNFTAIAGVYYNKLYQGDVGAAHDQVLAYKPLTTPLTSASWTNSVRSTTAKTAIDFNTVFGVPDHARAVKLRVMTRDTGSAANDCTLNFFAYGAAPVVAVASPSGIANNMPHRQEITVPLDASGRAEFSITASGANTFTTTVEVIGYFV
jgi:hypothetical protein